MARYDYPIVVIGAGAAGLVIAVGATKAGKKVLLIEKSNYGGDCTNYGCIPSKSLIASAHAAHAIRTGAEYGLQYTVPDVDASGALQRVRAIVQSIRKEEEPKALAKHGVKTLSGKAVFIDNHTLEVSPCGGGPKEIITADQIIIATGSAPITLPIPGIEDLPYLTNETVFDMEKIPDSMIVLGGGAIGCELSQAFSRLGTKVQIIEFFDRLMVRQEPEVAKVIEAVFRKEGLTLHLGYTTTQARQKNGKIILDLKEREGNNTTTITADKLLVAVGRRPNCSGLKLSAIGVECGKSGIKVDEYGRTSVKNIWAVGDVAGNALFTHAAENEARSVLVNLLSPLPWPIKKRDHTQAMPHCTFTDPEVAGAGLTEAAAKEKYGDDKIAVYNLSFDLLDRALTTGRTEGFVKVVTRKWSSKVLGATIVGPTAGDMLPEISLAMYRGIPLRKLAALIHAYPTYSLAVRKTADLWLQQTILPVLKKLIGK